MLPQMMPLPWMLIFFLLFICFYSFYLYSSLFGMSCYSYSNSVVPSKIVIFW